MQPEHIIGILKLRKHKNNLPVVCFFIQNNENYFQRKPLFNINRTFIYIMVRMFVHFAYMNCEVCFN